MSTLAEDMEALAKSLDEDTLVSVQERTTNQRIARDIRTALHKHGHGAPPPYQWAEHGDWRIEIFDAEVGQPMRTEISKHGKVVETFLVPGYKIWTVLAHWTEMLDAIDPDKEAP